MLVFAYVLGVGVRLRFAGLRQHGEQKRGSASRFQRGRGSFLSSFWYCSIKEVGNEVKVVKLLAIKKSVTNTGTRKCKQ